MNDDQVFIAGSSFHAGSLASLRKAVEITPIEFSSPAGLSALAIEDEALSSRNTGCQSISANRRSASAATAGAPSNTRICAPDACRTSIWESIVVSELLKVMSETIRRDRA